VAVNNGFDGNEAAWLLSLQGAAGPGGRAVEDAVAESKLYTDSRVDELNRRFDGFKDGVHAAVASSIAIASLPQPTDAGYSMLSVGMGTWEGEQGYAVGFSGVTENNKYVYKLAATTNTEGDFGAGASIGWQWK
jgi:autotransporter adhesin